MDTSAPTLDELDPEIVHKLVMWEMLSAVKRYQPYYKTYPSASAPVWGVAMVDWDSVEGIVVYGGVYTSDPEYSFTWLLQDPLLVSRAAS